MGRIRRSREEIKREKALHRVADTLLGKVEDLLENTQAERLGSQSMKHISGILKDIRDVQMIRSPAERREQQLRLEGMARKLESEQAQVETGVILLPATLEGETPYPE